MTAGSRATRFWGRGREGDELKGSKAGNKDAGRFTPAAGPKDILDGEESMVLQEVTKPHQLPFFLDERRVKLKDSRHRVS